MVRAAAAARRASEDDDEFRTLARRAHGGAERRRTRGDDRKTSVQEKDSIRWSDYGWSALICAVVTLLVAPLTETVVERPARPKLTLCGSAA